MIVGRVNLAQLAKVLERNFGISMGNIDLRSSARKHGLYGTTAIDRVRPLNDVPCFTSQGTCQPLTIVLILGTHMFSACVAASLRREINVVVSQNNQEPARNISCFLGGIWQDCC